jgi:hypothetical protein
MKTNDRTTRNARGRTMNNHDLTNGVLRALLARIPLCCMLNAVHLRCRMLRILCAMTRGALRGPWHVVRCAPRVVSCAPRAACFHPQIRWCASQAARAPVGASVARHGAQQRRLGDLTAAGDVCERGASRKRRCKLRACVRATHAHSETPAERSMAGGAYIYTHAYAHGSHARLRALACVRIRARNAPGLYASGRPVKFCDCSYVSSSWITHARTHAGVRAHAWLGGYLCVRVCVCLCVWGSVSACE